MNSELRKSDEPSTLERATDAFEKAFVNLPMSLPTRAILAGGLLQVGAVVQCLSKGNVRAVAEFAKEVGEYALAVIRSR